MKEIIKETLETLSIRLNEIREQYLYTFNTDENFYQAKEKCQQAVAEANKIFNGYCINAVLHFERINDGICANVDFIDVITGYPIIFE